LLDLLNRIYAHVPQDIANNGKAVLAFAVLGIGFYFLCGSGRPLSLPAAIAHVFRRDLLGHRSSRVDILHFFLTMGLWMPVAGVLVTTLFTIHVQDLLVQRFGARAPLLAAGPGAAMLQFLVIFLCRDFGTYVAHWLLHRVPLLWSVHRTHHSAEALTIFTSARSHPLEYIHLQAGITLCGGLGGGLFLYVTGMAMQTAPVLLLAATGIVFGTVGLAQHSHLPISFGKLNYIILAPVMHQLHHSAELRHRDKNLGGQLSVFDWMFGTLYLPREREDYRWGLNDQEMGENNPHSRLRDFYFEPARYALRLLTKATRSS
jgi:sterol desaturase/sphingolipid hydroxylase (fatty acid hydroxylase superfamily)